MKEFIDYITGLGYTPYREKGDEYVATKPFSFSSQVEGGIADYWVKDGDFENPIVIGLKEAGFAPTVIYPRPNIIDENNRDVLYESGFVIFKPPLNWFAANITKALENTEPELFYKSLYDKSIAINI